MSGKLNLYNLGDLGVDLVQSPPHQAPGSFSEAKNTVVRTVAGNHGLAKRYGMTKLNATAAAGAILAIANIPLLDPFGALHVSLGGGLGFRISENGTTWTTTLTPSVSPSSDMVHLLGKIYFTQSTTLYSFDGTDVVSVGSVGNINGGAIRITVDPSEQLLVIGGDDSFTNFRSYTYAPLTSTLTTLNVLGATGVMAGAIGGIPHVGADDNDIYRYTAGAWVSDFSGTNTAVLASYGFAQFGGKLYISFVILSGVDSNVQKIMRRDAQGSWTSVLDASGSYGRLCANPTRMFVQHFESGVSRILTSTNGTSWTQDVDLTASPLSFAANAEVGSLFVWNDEVYVIRDSKIGRRSAAGVWTLVDATLGESLGAHL